MSISLIAGIIVSLVVVSLVVSSISYSRQKAIAQRQKQLKKLKAEAQELIVHQQLMLSVDSEYDIILLLQKQLLKLLVLAQDLAPEDPEVATALARENNSLRDYLDGNRHTHIDIVRRSDEELAQSKLQLGQVAKQIDLMTNKGLISTSVNKVLRDRIKHIQLEMDVASHQAQADAYAEQDDVVLYQNHLKQARDALAKSPLHFEDKNAQIKALTDLINEVKRTNKIVRRDDSVDKSQEIQQHTTEATQTDQQTFPDTHSP